MPAEFIDLDLHRPVWAAAKLACRACPERCTSMVHVEADWDRLECPGCGGMTCSVTHYDGDPDSPEYVWTARLGEVKPDG